ncbi:hypothetical protein BCA37_01890 [Mycobacterium sp. djl-10]|nr:hypothetical protein BCA37_01890 [Mycobacterium sp. djl-10]
MHLIDIAGLPFKLGAALRHKRAFHPNGVTAVGRIERTAPATTGLPVASGEVIGRLSKGVGLPGGLADFAGLAWRMVPQSPGATPWDVLMVSAGSSALGRVVLRPATAWPHADFSTLMPLSYAGQNWWLQASVIGDVGSPALALHPISEQLRNGRPIRIEIRQATFGQAPTSLAILTFTHLLPEGEQETLAFDPTRNSAPGVTLSPGWLTALRRGAYRGSRQGRRDD